MRHQIKTILFLTSYLFAPLLSVFTLFAQTTTLGEGVFSDLVSLNIVLSPLQSIVVNPTQKVVNFVYENADDYKEGVIHELADHLKINSSGGFEVRVVSAHKRFQRKDGGKSLFASDVSVTASEGSKVNSTEVFSTVSLDNKALKVISSSDGGSELKYNVTYDNSVGGNDNYLNEFVYKANAGSGVETIFSTEITYPLVAK